MDPKKIQEYDEFDAEGYEDWTKRRHKKASELIKKPKKTTDPPSNLKGWW